MENKREFFRIAIYEAPVTISVGRTKIQGEIRDISGNGIGLYCKEDWETEKEIRVTFKLNEIEFTFQAKIVRKEIETLGRKSYGCKFLHQSEKEKANLSSQLFRMDANRKKK